MRPSQNVPLPPRIYPLKKNVYGRPFQNVTLPPRIYPSLLEYTFLSITMRHSQNLPLPLRIYPSPIFLQLYAIFQESSPQSLNIPPFLELHVRESTNRSKG